MQDVRWLKEGYPFNPSLADEISRLLLEVRFDPTTANRMQPIGFGTVAAAREDFRSNGRDTEYCPDQPEFSLASFSLAPAPAPRLPTRPYLGSGGWLSMSPTHYPRYVSHPNVQATQDIIKKAIIGGGLGSPATDGLGGGNGSGRGQGGKRECVFCRNNGEERRLFQSHVLKDKAGKVTCPVLRVYVCPVCSASGDLAHTLRYCPLNKNRNAGPNLTTQRFSRTSVGRRGCQPFAQQPHLQQRQLM